MAKLTSKERDDLGEHEFALPGKRKYPIENRNHARAALQRVSEFGSAEEKAKVRAAVKRKYPDMAIGGKDKDKGMRD